MDILLVVVGLLCIPAACLLAIRAERSHLPPPGSVRFFYAIGLTLICGGLAVAATAEAEGVPVDRLSLMTLSAVLALLFFCLLKRHREFAALRRVQSENQTLHQQLLDNVNDAVLILHDQRIVYANATFFRILGLEAEDCLGQHWERFAAPEEIEPVKTLFMRHDAGQSVPEYFSASLCAPDGRRLSVHIRIGRTTYQGQPATIAVLRDLTDQKTIIEYLRENEAKYRQIFEGDLSALYIIDTASREIVDANPAACAMYGYSRQEMLTLLYDDLLTRPAKAGEILRIMATTGTLPSPHDWHVRFDGTPFPVDLSAGICQLGYRSVVCASIRDVTVRTGVVKAEREARAAAERASMAKTRFLAMMSHELRTPMGVVTGILDELRRDGLSARHTSLVETAIQAADLLLETIDDVLDYAKLESDELVFEAQDFDCHALLQSLASHHLTLAQAKGLSLTLEISPSLPRWLHGDARRVRQIITQLLSNAVKFTERGSVLLKAHCDDAPGEAPSPQPLVLEVQVRDTGIGISANDMATVFHPFHQIDTSSTRRVGGLGLGLAVAHHLATRMGGDVTGESFPEVGSTFTFTVPLTNGQPVREQAPPQATGRRLNLLLVDDNRLNLKVITLTLNRMGHQVTEASNGVEAIQTLADAQEGPPFDLILMDIEMPLLDGMEATRRIRAGEAGAQHADIPILIMTAHSKALFHAQCIEAGATAFITKPIKRALLEPLFATLMDNAAAMPSVADTADLLLAQGDETPPAPMLWDREGILRRLECDEDFLNDLGVMFLEEAPRHMQQIKNALAAKDLSTVASAAHALKNECLNVGADVCRTLSETLVQAARSQDAGKATAAYGPLGKEMENLMRVMRETLPV